MAAFQNTSLNPFASREAEMDQRAQLLKRLSFTLFCSQVDQYVRALPDIQERLAESLRLSQVPSVHEQVFLCFRVLLLRISPHHLTGLWPTLISEMVSSVCFTVHYCFTINITTLFVRPVPYLYISCSKIDNFIDFSSFFKFLSLFKST